MVEQAEAEPGDAVPNHQRQVDELQAAVRLEKARLNRLPFRPSPLSPGASSDPLDHWIAEELECIRRHLDLLGDTLAADPILIHRHGRQLQSLDRIGQMLGHLSRVIEADDKKLAIEHVTIQDLRARLKRKPLRPLGR